MSISNDYPIVGYRFTVTIFSDLFANPIDLHFKEVSGLKMARTVNHDGNMTTVDSTLPEQTLTLKRGMIAGSDSLQNSQLVEGELWSTRLLRRDLLISVLDENDSPVKNWMVRNAYLSSLSWDGISGDSKDVLIESMEYNYRDITYMPDGF